MRYIGLDIATTTGWAYFKDDELLERGTIQLIPGMELPQKLHYFHIELSNILQRLELDYCFIEDVILGISGAKTLAYLARLNGVAINSAFLILQERVKLYEPTYWKAHSFDGLGGMAQKWEVQLAAIRHYNVSITGTFDTLYSDIDQTQKEIEDQKDVARDSRVQINKCKAQLNRKRDPLNDDMRKSIKCRIGELEKLCADSKDKAKSMKKAFDKKMAKVSNDIAAQTGFTENISDACGIAYCGFREMNHV